MRSSSLLILLGLPTAALGSVGSALATLSGLVWFCLAIGAAGTLATTVGVIAAGVRLGAPEARNVLAVAGPESDAVRF